MELAEYIESIGQQSSLMVQSAMSWATILFAYFVAAHTAGRRLTRLAAIVISVIYSAFLFVIFGAILDVQENMRALEAGMHENFPDNEMVIRGFVPPSRAGPYVLFVSAWAGSIWYMVYRRMTATTED